MKTGILEQRITEPQKPFEPTAQKPFIQPTWQMVVNAVDFTVPPEHADRKKLIALGAEFSATMAKLKPYGLDYASKHFKCLIRDCLDGKSEELPNREEIIKKFSIRRSIIKGQASEISKKGCLIAADILERALKQVPKFTADLLSKESAILPNIKIGESPIKALCAELPKAIQFRIDKLRSVENPMHNPATIFNLD